MAELLKEQPPRIPHVGDLVEGTVTAVSKSEVHIDVDGYGSGVIRGYELFDESGSFSHIKVSDVVTATLLELENENREMELSFRHAGHQKAWDELGRLWKIGEVIDATIVDANKGGLMVRVGNVDGFLPVSQLTTEHYPRVEGGDRHKILERLQQYVGSTFHVKLIDVAEREGKLIASEKAAYEEEHRKKLENYKVGATVEGRITGVVHFGAFMEFDEGLEGLIHISELAWQRIEDPHDIVKVGDRVKAQIISIERNRISLSMKRLLEDPWRKAVERYTVGQTVDGTVRKINPFGAFVELDEQIHGLAHISELADRKITTPGEVVTVGQSYPFRIISIDPEQHRLGLSLRPPRTEPEESKADTASPIAAGMPAADAGTNAGDAAPASESTPGAPQETPPEPGATDTTPATPPEETAS